MGQRTPVAEIDPGLASLHAQLDTACALLREASGESFELITDGELADEQATSLPSGWSLVGGADPQRREAAAELLSRVLDAEREIESLCGEILDRYEEVTLIQQLGLQLARAMDEESLAQVVVGAITGWLEIRTGEVWLRDGESAKFAGGTPGERFPKGPLGELGPLEALTEGTPWHQSGGAGSEAVLAIPVPGPADDPIGVIVLRGREESGAFEQREVQVLMAVAALLSGFLRSHRLARERWIDENRGRPEAGSSLLHPSHEPVLQGLQISAACRLGSQTGADFHDLVRTPNGGLVLNMARVSAGGSLAAMHLAVAKGVLQTEARRGSSPGTMLRRLNDVLSPELIRSHLFATAYVAHFHPDARRVDFASAGHAVPLLFRRSSGIDELDVAGPALGMLNAMNYHESTHELESGDLMLFYSDGFADARDPGGSSLGADSLGARLTAFHDRTVEQIQDSLLAVLDEHREDRALEQDATLLVAQVL